MRTRSIVTALALSLFTAPAAPSQTPDIVSKVERDVAIKRLQGVWVPELLVTPQGAETYPLGGRSLGFVDEKQFVRFEGRKQVALGTFTVEDGFLRLKVEAPNPWDLEAADTRTKVRYTFKVEGDLLTLCYSSDNKGKANDLTPGEGRQVVVYKRQRTDAKSPRVDR